MIKIKSYKRSTYLVDDKIVIQRMDHISCVSSFIGNLKTLKTRKKQDVKIYFPKKNVSIFPDACLPMVGVMEFFKKEYGFSFEIHVPYKSYLKRCHFEEPLHLTSDEIKKCNNPLDKVFAYTDYKQVAELTQAFIDCISRTTVCKEGVFDGLFWCINEVMDNVLTHSQVSTGYIMGQYHPKTKRLAICVYDNGIGIHKSFEGSSHSPATELDSITLALQEGVGDGQGQGNGLYGLYKIVLENGGSLAITSGHSSVMLKDGHMKKYGNVPVLSEEYARTVVDFQLDLSQKIDITSALSSIGGFEGFDIRIDNMIQDDDSIKYNVFENCSGTATRKAGAELRKDALNVFVRTQTPVILDFSGVRAVSSSFVDEFVAKLMVEMGPVKFNQAFKIVGMNSTVEHLCNRSIGMRMQQTIENVKKI